MRAFSRILRELGLQYWGRYYSIYKGFVSDNEDPDGRGRIKVKVPSVYGENVPNEWALPKGQFTGEGIGFFAVPNVDDPVWVMFEEGDPRFPVWEYGWRMKDQKLGEGKPSKKIFQTTGGHRIEIDDENDHVKVVRKNGKSIVLKGEKAHIGGNEDQSAALGDTTESKLEEILDLLEDISNQMTGATAPSSGGPLSTNAYFGTVIGQIQAIKQALGELKSSSVTVDK